MVQPIQWPFSELVLGAWLAIGLLFCSYNFFLGLILRQHWLTWIIAPGGVFVAIEYAYFGGFSSLLPSGIDRGLLLGYLGCLIVPPTIIATAAFTRNFLNLRQNNPRVDRVLGGIGLATLIPLIGLPFMPLQWISTGMFTVICAGAVAATYAHWRIWQSGGLQMRLLGGSWVLMGPALIAWFARNLGMVEGGPVTTAIYLTGFSGNLIILGIAAIARFRELNEQALASLKAAHQKNIAARKRERQLRDEIHQRNRSFDAQKARADAEFESKRAFMSLISHDLRGPLANASQALGRMLDGSDNTDKEGRERLLASVHETVQRQVSLVDRLLDLDTLAHSSGNSRAFHVNFAQIAQERLAAWESHALNKGLELINETDREVPLFGDALLISTLLDNLLANAIRHTKAGRQIIVRQPQGLINGFEVCNACPDLTETQSARIQSAVSEEGTNEHTTLAMTRVSDEPDTGSGRGIGLRLARALITAQGGELEYQYRQPWVTLRIVLPEAKPWILLVDDQAAQLTEMRERIHTLETDCEITEALGVDEAIERMSQRVPDLVISDIRMPGKDGFDLLSKIRHHRPWEEICVALISATASEEESDQLANQAMRAGADAYFNKPIAQDDLQSLITALKPAANPG